MLGGPDAGGPGMQDSPPFLFCPADENWDSGGSSTSISAPLRPSRPRGAEIEIPPSSGFRRTAAYRGPAASPGSSGRQTRPSSSMPEEETWPQARGSWNIAGADHQHLLPRIGLSPMARGGAATPAPPAPDEFFRSQSTESGRFSTSSPDRRVDDSEDFSDEDDLLPSVECQEFLNTSVGYARRTQIDITAARERSCRVSLWFVDVPFALLRIYLLLVTLKSQRPVWAPLLMKNVSCCILQLLQLTVIKRRKSELIKLMRSVDHEAQEEYRFHRNRIWDEHNKDFFRPFALFRRISISKGLILVIKATRKLWEESKKVAQELVHVGPGLGLGRASTGGVGSTDSVHTSGKKSSTIRKGGTDGEKRRVEDHVVDHSCDSSLSSAHVGGRWLEDRSQRPDDAMAAEEDGVLRAEDAPVEKDLFKNFFEEVPGAHQSGSQGPSSEQPYPPNEINSADVFVSVREFPELGPQRESSSYGTPGSPDFDALHDLNRGTTQEILRGGDSMEVPSADDHPKLSNVAARPPSSPPLTPRSRRRQRGKLRPRLLRDRNEWHTGVDPRVMAGGQHVDNVKLALFDVFEKGWENPDSEDNQSLSPASEMRMRAGTRKGRGLRGGTPALGKDLPLGCEQTRTSGTEDFSESVASFLLHDVDDAPSVGGGFSEAASSIGRPAGGPDAERSPPPWRTERDGHLFGASPSSHLPPSQGHDEDLEGSEAGSDFMLRGNKNVEFSVKSHRRGSALDTLLGTSEDVRINLRRNSECKQFCVWWFVGFSVGMLVALQDKIGELFEGQGVGESLDGIDFTDFLKGSKGSTTNNGASNSTSESASGGSGGIFPSSLSLSSRRGLLDSLSESSHDSSDESWEDSDRLSSFPAQPHNPLEHEHAPLMSPGTTTSIAQDLHAPWRFEERHFFVDYQDRR